MTLHELWNKPLAECDPFDAFVAGLAMGGVPFVAFLALLLLSACGSPVVAARILPPNVEQACDRALVCGAITADQSAQCVACLEHVDPKKADELRAEYGEIPPLEKVSCEDIRSVIHDWTDIGVCIDEKWRF